MKTYSTALLKLYINLPLRQRWILYRETRTVLWTFNTGSQLSLDQFIENVSTMLLPPSSDVFCASKSNLTQCFRCPFGICWSYSWFWFISWRQELTHRVIFWCWKGHCAGRNKKLHLCCIWSECYLARFDILIYLCILLPWTVLWKYAVTCGLILRTVVLARWFAWWQLGKFWFWK